MANRERAGGEDQQLPIEWDSSEREPKEGAEAASAEGGPGRSPLSAHDGPSSNKEDDLAAGASSAAPPGAPGGRPAEEPGGEGQPSEEEPESAPASGSEETPLFQRPSSEAGMGLAYDARYMRQRERILRGLRGGPPRGPWGRVKRWFDDQGPARVSLTVLFFAALLLAVYLGLALGASIEGGKGNPAHAGVEALPTTTPGVSQIACGTGSYTIEQGQTYSLTFDSKALAGYQIGNLTVRPVSANATAQALEAQAKPPFGVEVFALTLPGSAGRTDEYRLNVTFSKVGERDVTSECTVLVTPPSATSTPQPNPSPQATATATQRPAVTPTQPLPTPAAPAATATPPAVASPTRTAAPAVTPTRTP